MDARSLAETARVQVTTLNAWIHRGLVPGVSIGVRGHPRDFDIAAAVHVAVMTELVRLGIGAPGASAIASKHARDKQVLLLPDFSLPEGHVIHDAAAAALLRDDLRRAPL